MTKNPEKPKDLSAAEQLVEMGRLRPACAAALLGISPRTLRDQPHIPRTANGRYNARELFTSAAGRVERPKLTDDETEIVFQIADTLTEDCLYDGLAANRAMHELVSRHGEGVLIVLADRLFWLFQDAARYGSTDSCRLRPVVCNYCHRLRIGDKWRKAPKPADAIYGCCPRCEASNTPIPAVLASGKRWDED